MIFPPYPRRQDIFRKSPLALGLAIAFTSSGFAACGGDTKEPSLDDGGGGSAGGRSSNGGSGPGTGAVGGSGGNGAPGGTGAQPSTDGGTGGGGSPGLPWQSSQPVPEDERPDAADYELPIDVGSPGWRDSDEPPCSHLQGPTQAEAVWADGRGVFALTSVNCNSFAEIRCDAVGSVIYQNSGSGWERLFFQESANGMELGGFEDGALLVTGDGGLVSFEEGAPSKIYDFADTPRFLTVRGDTAYFSVQTGLDNVVWGLKGGQVTEVKKFGEPVYGLFALESGVLVGMENKVTFLDLDGTLEDIEGAPAGLYSAFFASAKDDFWVVQSDKQIAHYDGAWSVVHQVAGDGNVKSLWGKGESLFYSSDYEIGAIDGEGVHEIARSDSYDEFFDRLSFGDVWGLSENEVYFTYHYFLLDDSKCGGFGLLWYDGDELHRF